MECLRNKFSGGVLLDGGRYQTISPLNHGSFGMVFLAQDLFTNQTVAIKCLTKRSAPNDAGLDLAVDDRSEEFALHNGLASHPNIVNLLDKFETDSHLYLVMEFCSQGDLYEAIRNGHGPLQTEHVRQFMLELVDAVAYIHSKGVFHRDIKPENIFLTQDGAMKLGDFGLATTDKWSYETTVGSDRYMAPEQFDSAGAGYSPAEADIWAIGICLLNILFSRNPFTTPTEADPLFLDFSRDKQSLFDVFPTMSQDTYEVIVQCMNLDPKRRSLEGARDALLGVVSFTTEDESLDDFCCAEKSTVASAHREPLRTPSIQSPQVEGGAFPWAKVLHDAPARRQLSAIPDDESYTEDLFSKSGETADWCSASIQTPHLRCLIHTSVPP
ncbi:Serine/threonine-protein kinase ksp1 [Cladobotryum mycophilum]|uniref:non-specific serine/threonine protein kinase n=1 Tax=Cladobotryum mycophilum TaxID=491253 RepID=A0ABR0SZV8_9HYPO